MLASAAQTTEPRHEAGLGVAILMDGGPSLMYGLEAYEALGQFETQGS